jgi:hypothetical protein
MYEPQEEDKWRVRIISTNSAFFGGNVEKYGLIPYKKKMNSHRMALNFSYYLLEHCMHTTENGHKGITV